MVLIAIVLQIWNEMVRYCLPSRAATFKDTLSVAKSTMQITRSLRSKFVLVWKYGVKYGQKFKYGMEYRMDDF